MTDSIYRCPSHDFVTASRGADPKCPECGRDAELFLSGDRRRRLSKFVSGALRHFPEDAGVELDERGWTDYENLVRAVIRKYDWAGREHLAAVVATDPKGRFEREGNEIRAAYGHSVDVDLEADEGDDAESEPTEIPSRLYHGTTPDSLESILAEGLKPMGRQEVHLSETPTAAHEVGSRHADDPALLEIDAEGMVADERRISKRGEDVYTADEVPPEYVSVREQ